MCLCLGHWDNYFFRRNRHKEILFIFSRFCSCRYSLQRIWLPFLPLFCWAGASSLFQMQNVLISFWKIFLLETGDVSECRIIFKYIQALFSNNEGWIFLIKCLATHKTLLFFFSSHVWACKMLQYLTETSKVFSMRPERHNLPLFLLRLERLIQMWKIMS